MADPPPPYPMMPMAAEGGASRPAPSSSRTPPAAFARAASAGGSSGAEDVEMKAIMATLTNAQNASPSGQAWPPPKHQTAGASILKPPVPMQVANNKSLVASMLIGKGSSFKPQAKGTGKHVALTHNKVAKSEGSSLKLQLKKSSSMGSENNNVDTTSEDDDIPVAVPVDGDDSGEVLAAVPKSVKDRGKKTDDEKSSTSSANNASKKDSGKDAKKLKRLNSTDSASAKKRKKSRKSPTPGGKSQGKGGYQGQYRSAAAAHRSRQIHVPPIGSPGLLMLPTPANTAAFPPIESEEEARRRWLVKPGGGEGGGDDEEQEYLLPSTVFRQSMTLGGYTVDIRSQKPHRGSSTERSVGDMFDSDAGGLYLHFPELIPPSVWERRLGDKMDYSHLEPPPRKEVPLGKLKRDHSSGDPKKDGPRGPKGARSSYIFFTNAQRKLMGTEFPGMKFTEQGVIMGERWRALTPEQKKPYEDMAAADKERYGREMKEYIESVKREIRDEKDGKREESVKKAEPAKKEEKEEKSGKVGQSTDGQSKDGQQAKEELKDGEAKDSKNADGTKKEAPPVEKEKVKESDVKGPRLVDAMILSLSKMLGEKVIRKEPPAVSEAEPEPVTSGDKPEPASSGDERPESSKESNEQPPRQVSPDLTPEELPRFTPSPSNPRTRKRPRLHEAMSFLDMIPISLTAAYPPTYVSKRREYAKAVRARESAIIDAQEAKDDYDDAQEKYASRIETWEKMLEYQKQMVAKREDERKKQREKRKAAAEKEEAEKKATGEATETVTDDASSEKKTEVGVAAENAAEGSNIAEEGKKQPPKNVDENAENGCSDTAEGKAVAISEDGTLMPKQTKDEEGKNDSTVKKSATENGNDTSVSADTAVKKKKSRPPTPPPEDPMEYMPPRPQPPGPARVVSIPEIPTPPSPPLVVEVEDDNSDVRNDHVEFKMEGKSGGGDATVMCVPKANPQMLRHLDPSCFLPNFLGRYLGLLSNRISDPQFCGPLAPGIAGNSFGGGAGLATSYAGGGRGAAGVVGGPSRGLWQTPAGSKSSAGSKSNEKSEKKVPSKEKAVKPDEVKSSKSMSKVTSKANPAASSTKPSGTLSPTAATSGNKLVEDGKTTKGDAPISSSISPAPAKKKRPSSPSSETKPASSSSAEKPASSSTEKPKKKKIKRATAFGLAVGDRNTSATEIAAGAAGPDFPDGWIVKTYRRSGGETIGKTDRFWFSPGRNIRFRAKKHAKAFVDILGEPKVDGDEDKAAEIYRARGLHF